MRSEFLGYYVPSNDNYKRLWASGLFVLDTNVLLDLYRLPALARKEFLATLELLKDRLWIPHQVALEFQRLRLSVVAIERNKTEGVLSEAKALFDSVIEKVNALQIDKRDLGIESEPILKEIKEASAKLVEALGTVNSSQPDIAVSDPIRDKIDIILEGRVGPAPATQEDLNLLLLDGETRFSCKIPPGFMDEKKDQNQNAATFYHDGILYTSKFGDLILWRQIIKHARESGVKELLLVTADRKEDWWWKEKGKTIGPRPELVREMAKQGGVELFWMYSSDKFLENAKTFTEASVSDSSVNEVKEISRSVKYDNLSAIYRNKVKVNWSRKTHDKWRQASRVILEIEVLRWLRERFGEVTKLNGFPDFLVKEDGGLRGYEVRYVENLRSVIISPQLMSAILRGHIEIREGRMAAFSLVVGVDQKSWVEMLELGHAQQVDKSFRSILEKYPIDEIVVGYVDKSDGFTVVFNIVSEVQ